MTVMIAIEILSMKDSVKGEVTIGPAETSLK